MHDGMGKVEGIKGLPGFGSTLASNKFVRAALREEVRGSKLGIRWRRAVIVEYDRAGIDLHRATAARS